MADGLDTAFLALSENDENMLFFALQPESRRNTYDPSCLRFNLDSLTDDKSIEMFRFDKDNVRRLAIALNIPPSMECANRTICSGIDALCLTLRRLAYPNRLSDLETIFGRPKSTLSMITNDMIDFLHTRFGNLLTDLNQPWMAQELLQEYADAVHRKGSPLTNCFGFIDGTVRSICRPLRYQRVCYNGHKRTHALKFQSVVLPNGLIANLYGPVEGRRHDCALLGLSGLLDQLEGRRLRDRNGVDFALYGDPAYPLRDYLLCPFKGANVTPDQLLFNAKMSAVRTCVEWAFGKVLSNFAFLDFRKNLKILLQPVAKYYTVGALLTNCHTCVYGSQTGYFFELSPPTLEEYLRAV